MRMIIIIKTFLQSNNISFTFRFENLAWKAWLLLLTQNFFRYSNSSDDNINYRWVEIRHILVVAHIAGIFIHKTHYHGPLNFGAHSLNTSSRFYRSRSRSYSMRPCTCVCATFNHRTSHIAASLYIIIITMINIYIGCERRIQSLGIDVVALKRVGSWGWYKPFDPVQAWYTRHSIMISARAIDMAIIHE